MTCSSSKYVRVARTWEGIKGFLVFSVVKLTVEMMQQKTCHGLPHGPRGLCQSAVNNTS